MASNRTSSGGVRSLRAMFENPAEQASSPETRGRSPAASVTSNSERPLSKVRTSFVAVEASGQLSRTLSRTESQQRDTSRGTLPRTYSLDDEHLRGDSLHAWKMFDSVDLKIRFADFSQAVSERSQSIAEEPTSQSPSASRAIPDAPETPAPPIETVIGKIRKLSSNKESDSNPDKPVSTAEDTEAELKPADPKDEATVSGGDGLSPPQENIPPLAKIAAEKTAVEESARDEVPKEQENDELAIASPEAVIATPSPAPKSTPAKVNGTPTPTRSIGLAAKMTPKPTPSPAIERPSRPTPISSAKGPPEPTESLESTAESNLPVSKMPITPTSPTPAKSMAPPARSPAPTSTKSTTSYMKPTSTSAHHNQTNGTTKVPPRPSFRSSTASVSSITSTTTTGTRTAGGFIKPRPKSPTRPVKLPSHLVAPTASSAAKHDGPGAAGPTPSLGRKASIRSLGSARGPSGPPKLTISSRDRRPKKEEARSPVASKSAPDESFLARMMRPTASSASKVRSRDEVPPVPKVKISPAKKVGARSPHAERKKEMEDVAEAVDHVKDEEDVPIEEVDETVEEAAHDIEPAAAEPEHVVEDHPEDAAEEMQAEDVLAVEE
ncbi:hypothetical protein NA57DRAFT_52065 [Rhizodiscina lignyota]|uniref:Uncharacterized protein n=1 Tax=Rhizodiscina lignyota TaxID=1504668 RepID=A0A9P4MCI8_9PEZI|nr:hypothetical protein NA57DRAFT_52065 [Rhizodiscina lignyota]